MTLGHLCREAALRRQAFAGVSVLFQRRGRMFLICSTKFPQKDATSDAVFGFWAFLSKKEAEPEDRAERILPSSDEISAGDGGR